MPTYTFLDTITGEYAEKQMKMAEREDFMRDNPHMQQVIGTPLFIERRKLMGGLKTDGTFSDRLKEIKKGHWGSTMNVGNISEV
jgi:hypothetical protein